MGLGGRRTEEKTREGSRGMDLNRHFSKADIQMANKAHEQMLNIISHYANCNHTEIPLNTHEEGYKTHKK
jgi:hypothetical protein